MKVLIVDDEKHVREGIKLLGAWEQNGITEIYEAGMARKPSSLFKGFDQKLFFLI